MSITISSSNPDPFKIYLKYASDLEETEPVASLYCRTYYVKKQVEGKKATGKAFTPEENKLIFQLLNTIETSQAKLGLVCDARREKLEEFCAKIFVALEKEELSVPKLTKLHAVQFNTTANLIELLSVFGPLNSTWEDRRRFCRYKAVLILKCLKNGIDPPRGRPKDAPEIFKALFGEDEPEESKKGLPEDKEEQKAEPKVAESAIIPHKPNIENTTVNGNAEEDVPEERPMVQSIAISKIPHTKNEQPSKLTLEEVCDVIIPTLNQFSRKLDNKPSPIPSEEEQIPEPSEDVIIPHSGSIRSTASRPIPTNVQSMILTKPAPGKIRKDDPEFSKILSQVKTATEYALNEVQFMSAKNAKQFIKDAISKLNLLELQQQALCIMLNISITPITHQTQSKQSPISTCIKDPIADEAIGCCTDGPQLDSNNPQL
eukprot:TRINITY_DN105749_c0_g1_i1.p1 TRINITY_DN105749_c0_g1~~TRINITY_DN105749_c0_g1_i1.p1  ORF type:complete len:465 (+),score=40.17 TRINITY_DN105749_c0_g1_i1:105-1397(+)